jgi:hypothetical protein
MRQNRTHDEFLRTENRQKLLIKTLPLCAANVGKLFFGLLGNENKTPAKESAKGEHGL